MSPNGAWRGDRHLRVGLEIGARASSAKVVSVWLVDGPAVQRPNLPHSHIATIDIDNHNVMVQSFEDPRLMRAAAAQPAGSHHFGLADRGTVIVDVPIDDAVGLSNVVIRVADMAGVRDRPVEPDALAALADSGSKGVRVLANVTTANLVSHPDWAAVAAEVGVAADLPGGFEIYVDRAGKYRWRLRRPDGQIVADSGQGYAERSQCEADLRWIRTVGVQSPLRSLDLP